MDETTTLAPEVTTSEYGEYSETVAIMDQFINFIKKIIEMIKSLFDSLKGGTDSEA